MAEHGDDVALVRRWFRTLQVCVQTVDFASSRPLFANDLITFGTFTAFTIGREATEQEQWRHVWGHIDGFRWRLDDLRTPTPKMARRLTALDGQRLCLGEGLSARSGWPSTRTCRYSRAVPPAPLAQSMCTRLLYSATARR